MKLTEHVFTLLRGSSPQENAMREILAAGRVAKFAENYEMALSYFDRAMNMAQNGGDPTAITAASVHRAETLTRLRRWDEASEFIELMRTNAPMPIRSMHIAYMDCARGVLAQAQGDFNAARTAFESAQKLAKQASTSGAEGRALGHLGDMYLREGNASYAVHLLRESLPRLSESSDIELSSYFVGLLGLALTQTGQESEGQVLLQRALQLAEQFSHHLYERHWGILLGERAINEARYLDARAHLQRIVRLLDAKNPIPAYVLVMAQISKASIALRDLPAALEHAEKAAAALDHLVDPPVDPPTAVEADERLTALARGALGKALRANGRSAEAIPHLDAAQQIYTHGDHPDREGIDMLRVLAAAYSETGNIDAARQTYERALKLSEALTVKQDDSLELAQTRRDLGLMYVRVGQYAQAIQEWQAALTLYEQKKSHAQIARLCCDLGNARKALWQPQRAMKDFEQALMALNNIDEADLETRGLVLSNAANAYSESGDADSADAFFSEAITLAERTGNQVAEATRCGNYGWFLILVGRPRRAIATLERALRISQTLNLHPQLAIQTDNLGLAHDSLSEYPTALHFHRQALERLQGDAYPYWQTAFTINLAHTLISLGETDEAAQRLEMAIERARSIDALDLTVRALMGQARIALIAENLQFAGTLIDEAIGLARRAELRRLLADLLYLRSQQQERIGSRQTSAAAWEEAHRLYTMLHMPQAKLQPAWLTETPT